MTDQSKLNNPQAVTRPDPTLLMQLSFAFANTQILQTACELEVFTHLDNGCETASEVANASGATERGVRILLNALTGFKVLEKHNDGRYHLTPTAKIFLSRTSPSYLGDWIGHMNQLREPWLHLTEAVRTGKPYRKVETEEHGAEFFSKFVGSLFVMGKRGADAAAQTVVDDRRGLRILDVGAGSGVWGIAFAQHDPEARVTIADFSQVIEVTKGFVSKFGLTDRFEYIAGNFRATEFGEAKYDVATLGHIVHSEGEHQAKQLFRKIRRALKPDGQLVIGEFLADEQRRENQFALVFAANMLVNTEAGDTFTLGEISEWLREAGFGEVSTIDAPAPSPLIVGKVAAAKEKAA